MVAELPVVYADARLDATRLPSWTTADLGPPSGVCLVGLDDDAGALLATLEGRCAGVLG